MQSIYDDLYGDDICLSLNVTLLDYIWFGIYMNLLNNVPNQMIIVYVINDKIWIDRWNDNI